MILANYMLKTGVFFLCAIIAMICLNGVHVKVTVVHKFDDRIKAEIDHKTPYPLKHINGY